MRSDPEAMPSLQDVFVGLVNIIMIQARKDLPDSCKYSIDEIQEQIMAAFAHMAEVAGVKHVDRPLDETELVAPESPVARLLLFIYSMEPNFQDHLSHICRTQNVKLLKNYGPLSRVMSVLLRGECEANRRNLGITATAGGSLPVGQDDDITTCRWEPWKLEDLKYFSKSFIAYRGVTMDPEVLEEWRRAAETLAEAEEPFAVNFPFNFSVNLNIDEEIKRMIEPIEKDGGGEAEVEEGEDSPAEPIIKKKPVLFALSVQNYVGFQGFSFTHPNYSAFAEEKEIVLREGVPLFLLKV